MPGLKVSIGNGATMRILLILITFLSCSSMAQENYGMPKKDVIFLGQSHNSEIDHQVQLSILKILQTGSEKSVSVMAEMFNETAEAELEKFASNEAFLDFDSEFWKEQWGHPYSHYKPIFEYVKQQGMNLTHLRPDPARTSSVKKRGAVAAVDLLDEFLLGPSAYKKHLTDIAMAHMPKGGGGHVVSPDLMNQFFLVQCFWDEYMSWRIAEFCEAHPGTQVVVLVGHGHLHRDFGIQSRLLRRSPDLKIATIGFEKRSDWLPDYFYSSDSSTTIKVCGDPLIR